MKNKIISLFGNDNTSQDVKYSKLLQEFIDAFAFDFTDTEDYEDIVEFAINAWNFGNMKLLLPKVESEAMINSLSSSEVDVDLLKRMIYLKMTKFKNHDRFIADFEIEETTGNPILSVITQGKDDYLASMVDSFDEEFAEEDFEENYIDRKAIILKPLQPLQDWLSKLYPNAFAEANETRTYLISDQVEDLEVWLSKKFDKLFMLELEELHSNKKEWPQNRNYKMFRQWFDVERSAAVYDLENEPISKF
ncbi:hypothetical protein [Pedobacter sp.]|uniref:hypothetical protein n=1 Tax=Pedobacter sp. TaxID=1411316 RepID=UPI003BAD08F7